MSDRLGNQKGDMANSLHIEEGQHLEIDPEKERALLRKIDFRLVPCVWFMYLLSYVSRLFLELDLRISSPHWDSEVESNVVISVPRW